MYQKLLSRTGLSLDRLANFCQFADEGSIAKAAKGDAIRQSLISRQIRDLSEYFGVELVWRKGRGLELTAAGRELAAIGRSHFTGLNDFLSRCQGSEWTARIVASNSVGFWLVLPAIEKVRTRMPNVRIEIHHEQTREMATATREGTYDIAFIRQDALLPGLKSKVLRKVGHTFLVPKALSPKPPRELARALESFPAALPIGGRMREALARIAAKRGRELHVSVACTSYLHAAKVLESGTAAAVLPDLALPFIDRRKYHALALPEKFTLCLVWSGRNVATRPALAELVEVFSETLTGA
ncbi:MAG: LysR family transcriptional regulator [Verrucomicrobia bacterium]|nr:LysR family transcriptional regulator [Verrucomicrobiota bacterium]